MRTTLTPPETPSEIREELAPRLRWTITRLARRLRQEAGTDLGPSQVAALATIERHGPLSPSELADAERIKRPTATRILRHLEEAALVERVKDPEDGRGSIVSITAAGPHPPEAPPGAQDRLSGEPARQASDAEDRRTLERAAELLEGMLE